MLTLKHVTKSFGSSVALDDVVLEVPQGQMVGVIGASGAGKSTMLRLINRLVEPTAGHILYNGADVLQLKGAAMRAWRARCAMIFQQFNLVNRFDVLTNVLIGRCSFHSTLSILFKHFSAEERVLAARALERMNLLPQALQRADTLSGGQQQRVAIARALMQEPRIILADEPIASLDPANAQTVMDTLRAVNREDGITVICNLHTLDTARRYCDRIVGLSRGRIVFSGMPAELDPETVRRIYGHEAAELDETVTSTAVDPPVGIVIEPVTRARPVAASPIAAQP